MGRKGRKGQEMGVYKKIWKELARGQARNPVVGCVC